MKPDDEVDPPGNVPAAPTAMAETTGSPSPPAAGPDVEADLAPETILGWIAAAGPGPWFPAIHAKQFGIPRDRLDEPLNTLRLADLVRIAAWERGIGQGYMATPEGEAAVKQAATRTEDEPAITGIEIQNSRGADTEQVRTRRHSLLDQRAPVVTHALLVANLIWFTLGLVIAWNLGVPIGSYLAAGHPVVLDRLGALSAESLVQGGWWRLLTSCFVHVGFWHLLMNMVGLLVVGPIAELLWGRWRVLVIYFLAGLGGGCLAMALRPLDPSSGAPLMLAGASGAIWGVMGSLAAWLILFRRRLPREFAADFARRLVFAFVLNIGISLLPGVSWEGHAGGGIVGFLAAGLLNARRSSGGIRRMAATLLLVAIPVLCVAGLAVAMRWSDAWAPLRNRTIVVKKIVLHNEHPSNSLVWDGGLGAVNEILQTAQSAIMNQQLVSLVNAIGPESVRPLESRAVLLLSKESSNRRPEEVAALRAKVGALRVAAAELSRRLATPAGKVEVDARRARVHAFADARLKSLDLLNRMIESKTAPGVEEWKTWGEAKRGADRLWGEILEPASGPESP